MKYMVPGLDMKTCPSPAPRCITSFQKSGLPHRQDPGRCRHSHSGSDPDDPHRAECQDDRCAGDLSLPAQR